MSRRSIRWRLFTWYALILVMAFAALAWALHRELQESLVRDADARLSLWLESVRHKVDEYPEAKLKAEIATALPTGIAFEVWNAQGQLVASSMGGLKRPAPQTEQSLTSETMRLRTAGSTNAGWIRLQMDIASEQQGIERFLRVLLMATVAILALALIGGWIVTTRALASIGGMTATALEISADNLSERIDTESTPVELEGLARTLNDSFQRLEAAFDRQARFTADASHELRTPLAIIHAHLELALSKGQDPDKLRGRVEASFAAAKRMRAVVEGCGSSATTLISLLNIDLGLFRARKLGPSLLPMQCKTQ